MKEVIPDIFIGEFRWQKFPNNSSNTETAPSFDSFLQSDTMGYAFTYPTVRLFSPNVSIGSYTHYPTISTDMLRRVRNRETGHTNNANVSSSRLKSNMKLWLASHTFDIPALSSACSLTPPLLLLHRFSAGTTSYSRVYIPSPYVKPITW